MDLKSKSDHVEASKNTSKRSLARGLTGCDWKGCDMDQKTQDMDQSVLSYIEQLVNQEHRLYERGEQSALADADRHTLEKVQVELDRCWDLLRQRRALRGAGIDPDQAQVRPAQVVERYEQ